MPKASKSNAAKSTSSTRTGTYVVARPAVSSKISMAKIRAAVRKVNAAQVAKK